MYFWMVGLKKKWEPTIQKLAEILDWTHGTFFLAYHLQFQPPPFVFWKKKFSGCKLEHLNFENFGAKKEKFENLTSLFSRQKFQNSNVRVYTQKIFFFQKPNPLAVFVDGRRGFFSRVYNLKFQRVFGW